VADPPHRPTVLGARDRLACGPAPAGPTRFDALSAKWHLGQALGRWQYDRRGMATVRDSPGAVGSETSGARAALRARGSLGFAVVVALVLLPLAVVLVAIAGASWHPASDLAVEVLRIGEVGGRHTPLVGVHSRYGWDHPGPLLFWALAPFRWVLGTKGVLVGVVVLNALAIVGALLIARRRGGLPLVVLVGGALLTLTWALGPSVLADPWNPWVAVLPFFTFVLLAWDLADGELRALPWLVGVGTFLVQAHLGYTLLVLGLGLAAAVLARGAVRHGDAVDGAVAPTTVRRSGLLALVVAAVLWIPPVLQQLFGAEGNLTAILHFVRHPSETAVGWRIAWGILGTELGFPGAWLTGRELDAFGVRTSSTVPALILLAAMATLGAVAWRRGAVSAGRLATLAVVATGLGVVSGARVTGLVGSYLVRWWWVIAAFVWLSVAWSIWSLLSRTRARRVLAAVSVAAMIVLAGAMVGRAGSAHVPSELDSVAIGQLGDQIAEAVGDAGAYVVDWTDARDWGAVGSGVFVDLGERGLAVEAASRHASTFGPWRTVPVEADDGLILVVGGDEIARGFEPPPDAIVIAQYNPLTPSEQGRVVALELEIGRRIGEHADWDWTLADTVFGRQVLHDQGAPPDLVAELSELRARGSAYTVFLQPHD
jgi:hypothetical protein